ncbi:MAG: PAS domain S-box protein [Elusimicrobiota bacterium]
MVSHLNNRHFGKMVGALLLTLAAALGFWFFVAASDQRKAIEDINRRLVVINYYKAAQISDWRDGHYRDTVLLTRHPFFGGIVSEEMARSGSKRAELNAWLNDRLMQKKDLSLAFLSPKGAVIAATPGYTAGTEKDFKEAFARASQKGTPLMTDLYLAADGRPRITKMSPMSAGWERGGKIICVLVINIDPETEFYPLLKAAPLFLDTAETLLVRKDGKDVLYLNELQYIKDSALKFRHSLSDRELPAAKAINENYSGVFEGVDYRDVKVFSAIQPLEGSGWSVITKIDRKVLLTPVRTREYLELALILLAAGFIYGVFYVVLRFREKVAERVIQESEELLSSTLRSIGDGVITTDTSGRVTRLNVLAEHLTGWTTAEAKGRPVMDVFRIIHAKTRTAAENPVEKALRENTIVGLANHTVLIARDGTEYQIADSCAPIHDAAGITFGVVLVFRDVTEAYSRSEQLRRSEEKTRTIFDTANTGIAIVDNTGKYIMFNNWWLDSFGYDREEMKSLTNLDLTHPDDKDISEEWLRKIMEGKVDKYRLEKRFLRKDKSVFWGDLSVSAIKDEDNKVVNVVGLVTDITEHKQAEIYTNIREEAVRIFNEQADLKDLIQRFVAMLKAETGFDAVGIRIQDGEDFPYLSQDGFPKDFLLTENTLIARDADGAICRDKDGKVRLECTCGLVISGKTNHSNPLFTRGGSFWTNNSFPLLDLPAGQDPRYHPRNQCMHHGYASMALVPIRTKERIIGLIHIDDRRKGVFTLDIVECLEGIAAHVGEAILRRQAEDALKQISDRLILATRAGGVGVWDYDIAANKLVWDDQMYALYGIKKNDFAGAYESWQQGLHPEDKARGDAEIQMAIRGEKEFNTEFRVVWPDGSIRDLRALAIVQRDQSGRPLKMVGTNWDITDQKRAERTIKETADTKSKFASLVSHELRSPLTSIMLGVSLILEEAGGLSAEHKSLLELVHGNADRLGRLINNVLDFQKIAAGKMTFDIVDADISALIHTAAQNMILLAQSKGLELKVDMGADIPRAMADKDKITQVLTNLLNNAIAHTEKGCITVHAALDGGSLHVSVRDTGIGIKAEDLPKLFQAFEQLDSGGKKGGTGLGLAISKEIIIAHNGKIWAESEPGKGSVFHFTLPVKQG